MIEVIWPKAGVRRRFWDRAGLFLCHLPGFCVVCGRPTLFTVNNPNLRENVVCRLCGSFNRQRQIVYVLLRNLLGDRGPAWASISDIPTSTVVWNVEAARALHDRLSRHLGDNHVSSDFLDPALESGQKKGGIMHVDMQKTHFADSSLDVILSSDVLEHMPRPEDALRETYRILRPGGCHVFTVPFFMHRFTNEKRAAVTDDGRTEFLLEKLYHSDPIRAEEGALVYNIFAPELLCMLEAAGFETKWCRAYSPVRGILGDNGVVIVARKPVNT